MEILLPLIVLPLVVALFSWIEQTVLPDMWKQKSALFGHGPTLGELVLQKAAKFFACLFASVWWLLILSLSLSAALD